MHVLTIVQLSLITIGLIFQVVAMSALYRDWSNDRGNSEPEAWHDTKVDLGHAHRSGRTLPRHSVHDYYEIEKTPHGVSPADLRKTARVKYIDNGPTTPTP